MKLENIALKEFLQLDNVDEYHFAFKYASIFKEKVDHLGIGNLLIRSFGAVKDIQELYGTNFNVFDLVKGLTTLCEKTEQEIYDMGIVEFVQARNYFESELEKISNAEAVTFNRTPTDRELRAGIENMGIFGVELQLDSLCQGDITRRDKIRAEQYGKCFTWLAMWQARSDFQEEYNRIANAI